jgi:hypothetical protein
MPIEPDSATSDAAQTFPPRFHRLSSGSVINDDENWIAKVEERLDEISRVFGYDRFVIIDLENLLKTRYRREIGRLRENWRHACTALTAQAANQNALLLAISDPGTPRQLGFRRGDVFREMEQFLEDPFKDCNNIVLKLLKFPGAADDLIIATSRYLLEHRPDNLTEIISGDRFSEYRLDDDLGQWNPLEITNGRYNFILRPHRASESNWTFELSKPGATASKLLTEIKPFSPVPNLPNLVAFCRNSDCESLSQCLPGSISDPLVQGPPAGRTFGEGQVLWGSAEHKSEDRRSQSSECPYCGSVAEIIMRPFPTLLFHPTLNGHRPDNTNEIAYPLPLADADPLKIPMRHLGFDAASDQSNLTIRTVQGLPDGEDWTIRLADFKYSLEIPEGFRFTSRAQRATGTDRTCYSSGFAEPGGLNAHVYDVRISEDAEHAPYKVDVRLLKVR